MQSVRIEPKRRQLRMLVAGLFLLCLGMLAFPPLCAPLSLLVPLLACPLVGRRQEPMAWIAAVMPSLSAIMAGGDPLYAASLIAVGSSTLLITRLVPMPKRAGLTGVVWYTCAIAFSLALMVACASRAMGGPLWKTVTDWVIASIEQHEQAGLVLYRCAAAGLLRLPEGYPSSTVLMHVFEPVVIRQMLMSLRLTLESVLLDLLPSFFVQSSLIVGLFTALRVQRIGGMVLVVETRTPNDKKTRVAVPPGFSLVTLPPKLRWPVLGLALASMFLLMTDATLTQIMGQMCYTLFETVYVLLGAAVLVWVFSRRSPEKKKAFGVLAAVMYVLAPFALFLIGLTDQTFHYRSQHSGKTDESI